MNSKWLNIGIVMFLSGLNGCATMNADECAASDWSAIGYEDGSRGYTEDRFGGHRKACAKHGITPDFVAYQAGRNRGLESFCQPGRGFSYGANGGQYSGVCAADLEPEFLDAYHAGRKLYTLRSNVGAVNSQLYAAENALEATRSRITTVELLLINSETTTDDRVALLAELKELSERKGKLKSDIKTLVADQARLEQDLQYYEQTVADLGY
jgi:outer membrane murein-binding lipoprotein Lpp